MVYTFFQAFRWAIPHICDFGGKAIYTDVDMINLHDIGELYDFDMQGKPFAARKGKRWGYELCVMLIDCEKAKEYIWSIDKLKSRRDSHKYHRDKISSSELIADIDQRWNCLDGEGYDIQDIKQLHFTNMATQPWKPSWFQGEHHEHPRKDLIDLFYELKKEAIDSGMKPRAIKEKKLNIKLDYNYNVYSIILPDDSLNFLLQSPRISSLCDMRIIVAPSFCIANI